MSEDSETGDIGHRMDIGIGGEVRADAVEQRRGADHFLVTAGRQRVLLNCCRIDADANPLGQDERVSGFYAAIAANLAG